MDSKFFKYLILGGAVMMTSSLAYADGGLPSREEMWRTIQHQQKQIEALQKGQANSDSKIEATAEFVEQAQKSGGGGDLGWWDKTQIGGYGELHYNGLKDNGNDEIDLHRFVVFIGHDFTDDIRFFSELEVEHSLAGEGKNGEVEVEQAYVEFDLNDTQKAKAGLFLVPVGILNETHEPDTFFGVERNPIEKNIIPSTWWEGGVGLNGEIGNGFSYDAAIHSGLKTPTSGSNAFKIRKGRQKASQADADKGAITGRLKWTGQPGVELGVTAQYQQDIAQDDFTEKLDATLLEAHADIRKGPWGLRALYARWDIDGDAPEAVGRDEQVGWYIEPSYRIDTKAGEVGVFARYNQYDNEAGDNVDSEYVQYDIGANYWPHPNVVLKGDMQFNKDPGDGEDDEILNLGVGLQF